MAKINKRTCTTIPHFRVGRLCAEQEKIALALFGFKNGAY